MAARTQVDWGTFCLDVCVRFQDCRGRNVVEEFNKLNQEGALEDYLDCFEELKSLMIQETLQIPESFFLDNFIGGLNPSLKHFVRAFNPQSLYSAVEYARLKEKNDEAMKVPNSSKPSVPQLVK